MVLWAGVLAIAWIGQALQFAISGELPALEENAFRLIAALDLSLVVTPLAIGAFWLWKWQGWGVVIAIVLNVKGAIYALLLAIGSFTTGSLTSAGGDGLLWLWVFLTVGSSASLVVLLRK